MLFIIVKKNINKKREPLSSRNQFATLIILHMFNNRVTKLATFQQFSAVH